MMREQSITLTILYNDDIMSDDTALVLLDKAGDWLIDIDGFEGRDTKFHAARAADLDFWADWLYDPDEDDDNEV